MSGVFERINSEKEEPVNRYDFIRNRDVTPPPDGDETGDYSNRLSTDYDIFKADTNGDRVVSYDEYRTYILQKGEVKPYVVIPNESTFLSTLSADVVFVTVTVCVTAIILFWIKISKSQKDHP